MSHYLLHLR